MAIAVEQESPAQASRPAERRALGVACGAHALHDGYTDLIYVILPILQTEFGLPYAAVGLLRTTFTGTMAIFQIPASLLAERFGYAVVLAGGTALAGACFCLAGTSAGFATLVVALLLGGLGASTQHPIGSALVTRAFSGPRSLTAFGNYNFAGDVGKVLLPASAAALLLIMPWRPAVGILGALGLAAAVAIFLAMPRFEPEPTEPNLAPGASASGADTAVHGAGRRSGFWLLLAIGAIDSVTRAGFLVFLPFMMIAKGASVPVAGVALTLTFIGGAAGKFSCARLGARFGVINTIYITEALTAAGIVAIIVLPLEFCFALLPFIGTVLSGTSSLTYGSVPEFVTPAARPRAFGIFYTGTIGAGALGPTASGLLGDALGIPTTLVILAAVTLLTLPLAFVLRPAFAQRPAG